MKLKLTFLFLLFSAACFSQVPVVCNLTYITTIQTFDVYEHNPSGVTMYKAKMYIDADGSPRAYGPSNTGLDWTANAGSPGSWWGVVTDLSGNPILQTSSDPYPGMYVSTTSLVNSSYGSTNPLRYTNSETVPFFVLPSPVVSSGGITIGDIGYVYNTLTGQGCFAIYADAGPSTSLGEGSIYLAAQVGVDPDVRTGGTSSGIIDYIVFPNSGYGQGTIPTIAQIDSIGNYEINLIGGTGVTVCLGGPDLIDPTTTVSAPTSWATTNFPTTFTDLDNTGGSGIEKSFYQVLENNGTEWRANNGNGFFYDNFDAAIHPDWTMQTGTWAISTGYLDQSDQTNSNTNIWAPLSQNLSDRYLYNWQGKINGTGTNRRAGLHFFSDNASLPNRGNSYFVYFRIDGSTCEIYKVISDVWTQENSIPITLVANQWYDYKVLYDRISGKIDVYQNDVLVNTWTDPSPYLTGNFISLRSGNCDYEVNDLKVYRSRSSSVMVSIGAASTNDVRYQNVNPSSPSCRIKSITKDAAGNLSSVASQDVNIDWTNPSGVSINDGITVDVDTTFSLTQLSANWTNSVDPHSGLTKYWYAIGTSPGATDIVNWTNNALSTSKTQTGLSLTPGQYYYYSVQSEDGAGLLSSVMTSDGQLVLLATEISDVTNGLNLIAYPNPFSESTTIAYELQASSIVEISLVDLLGKQIVISQKENQSDGKHQIVINKNELQLSKGMYLLKLRVDSKELITRLIIQ